MSRSRSLVAWIALGTLALAVTACSESRTETTRQSPPAKVEEAPPPPPVETPTEPPAPAVMTENLSTNWTLVGTGPRAVVIADAGDDGATETYHLYGPGTVSGGSIVVGAQWDTSRVEARWAAVQRAVEPNAVALALVTLERTPNDGLSAGVLELVVRTYDVNGTKLGTSSTPVRDGFEQRSVQELGLLGDTLVLLDDGLTTASNGRDTFAEAVDVTAGGVRWTSPCGTGYSSAPPMYAGSGVVALGCDYNGVRGFDLATGATVWQYASGGTQQFNYDASAPGVVGVSNDHENGRVTIDLIHGTKLLDEGRGYVIADPVSGLQSMGRLQVYDPATQATVLSIDSATIDQLGDFMALSAFDGRLTFLASDGLNVVSLSTGQADPSSPAKSAEKQSYRNVVADAGTGWVVLGSISSSWDPDSWVRSAPVAPYAVTWATAVDGTLTWGDVGGPSISTD